MLKSVSRIAIVPAVVALIVLAGCSSSPDVGGPNPNLGSVTGRIVVGLTNPTGLPGIVVWIGIAGNPYMFTATSGAGGFFTIQDVTPRTVPSSPYQVIVDPNTPETNLVIPPPGILPTAYVFAGGTTDVGVITLVDADEVPPDPV
jgi:hypothetical protein